MLGVLLAWTPRVSGLSVLAMISVSVHGQVVTGVIDVPSTVTYPRFVRYEIGH